MEQEEEEPLFDFDDILDDPPPLPPPLPSLSQLSTSHRPQTSTVVGNIQNLFQMSYTPPSAEPIAKWRCE